MAQPPLPQTMSGSVSFFGNASRSVGRKTRRPGEPNAFSEVIAYGPATASGAPSRGNALAIISGVMPGGCAKLIPANPSSTAAATMDVLVIFMAGPPVR